MNKKDGKSLSESAHIYLMRCRLGRLQCENVNECHLFFTSPEP